MNIIERKEEKKQEKQEKKVVKEEIKRKRQGGGGKRAGSGKPRSPEQRGILKIIAARTQNANAEVYNLTNQKFAKDIDKILKNGVPIHPCVRGDGHSQGAKSRRPDTY